MARLEYQIREVSASGVQPATLVELSGSVDPDTLEIFEGLMDKLIDAGKRRIIYDFHKIKYINSTGMGMMVQFNDTLSEDGGGLVLMRIQPKVLLVVEMLGLQALFKIAANQAEAERIAKQADAVVVIVGCTFHDEGEGGGQKLGIGGDRENLSLHPKDEELIQAVTALSQRVIVVMLEEDSRLEIPESVPVIAAEPEAGAQPSLVGTVNCPSCRAELSMPTAGTYRCPRCRAALQVDGQGAVEAYPEPVAQVTELSIPADDDYLAGARQIVALAGKKAGLAGDAADAMAAAAEGCLRTLAVSALNGAAAQERLHLFIRPATGKLIVRIYCGGKPLASAGAMDAFKAGVDRLEYSASTQGNLVTLEKQS